MEAVRNNTAAKANSLRMIRSLQTNSCFIRSRTCLCGLLKLFITERQKVVSVSAASAMAWKLYTKIDDVQPRRVVFPKRLHCIFPTARLNMG
jgi:hypothetical protein